jgi:hypothetical protein
MICAWRFIPLAVAFCLVATASAQDARLAALHATLETLHEHATEISMQQRMIPELTVAKHQLRDWIETKLESLVDLDRAKGLEREINQELTGVSVTDPADDQDVLGSIGEVRLDSESGLLIVTTGVGIVCAFDASAYGYKRVAGHWKRVFESEQDDYAQDKYAPQSFDAVHVWQPYKEGQENAPLYIMTLGNEQGCSSNWHNVYYRVWRVDASDSKLLIDRSEFAHLRTFPYVVGSIGQDLGDGSERVDVLIEFTEGGVDAGFLTREAIRHFLIDGDNVHRVAPVALSPRDFVDEWLTRPWNESAAWSASSPVLRQRHGRIHADFVAGEFGDTTHCETPDLWQVDFAPSDAKKDFARKPDVYFLVRWNPPYRFTMVDVRDTPWPRCQQIDKEADQWRTLFNSQEWRWF